MKVEDKIVITTATACQPKGAKGEIVGLPPVQGWNGMLVRFEGDVVYSQFVYSSQMASAV
jgi:hypothetical protein